MRSEKIKEIEAAISVMDKTPMPKDPTLWQIHREKYQELVRLLKEQEDKEAAIKIEAAIAADKKNPPRPVSPGAGARFQEWIG